MENNCSSESNSLTNCSFVSSSQINYPSINSGNNENESINKNRWNDFKDFFQKKFVSLKSKLPGTNIPKPGSLCNLNSTCYMNSVIQMLASSDNFINKLNEMNRNYTNSLSLICLLDVLNGVNEEDALNENLHRNTERLKKLIETIKWYKSSEQDSFDLLTEIISNISHDFRNQKNIEIPLKLKLIHKFRGFNVSSRIQEYLGLSLNLCKNYERKSGIILEYLIDQHFEPSNVDGDLKKIIKLNLYEKPPDILLIHIQANKWDKIQRQMVKPRYSITYEEKLTLWLDIVTNLNENKSHQYEVQYDLKAVLHHMGEIDEGHYVTYRKWKERWYLMNDQFVKEIKFTRDISPYLMLYELNSMKINT